MVLLSSISLSSVAWAIMVAGIGSVIVFIGLCIEQFADWMNDRYLEVDFKPHKPLGRIGWYILMIGIAVEIGVASWVAYQEWQQRPENRPIFDMTAIMYVDVMGTNELDLTNTVWGGQHGIAMVGQDGSIGTLFPMLTLNNLIRGRSVDSDGNRSYAMRFDANGWESLMIDAGNINFKVSQIATANRLYVSLPFLPNDSVILSGKAEVIVNDSMRYFFKFPKQRLFIQGSGVNVINFAAATNCPPPQIPP